MVCPPPDTAELEKLFRYEVFKMLKSEGKKFMTLIPYCVLSTLDLCVLSRLSRINKSSKRSSNIWTYGMSSENRLRERTVRQLKPSSSMMNSHRPARMIT
jgi:hypothetical protein